MAYIERKKNGSVKIIVSGGYDVKGKQIRHSTTIEAAALEGLTLRQKEKEIERQKVLFEQKVKNGTYLDGERITFAAFAEKWLTEYAEKQLAPATLHVYKLRIEKRIIPALGHIKLSKLQPHHLLEFYNNLSENNGIRLDAYYIPSEQFKEFINTTPVCSVAKEMELDARTYIKARRGQRINYESADKICAFFKKGLKECFKPADGNRSLSNKTVKHHHDLISAILSAAVKWGVITSNPAERVTVPKTTKGKSLYYDDRQVMEMFRLLENEPLKYKAIIYLTIDTGLRLSEAAGLEWGDIDFSENTLEINKQRQYIPGFGTFVKEPKTENGYRNVSVSDTVISILKEYRKEQRENKLKLGSAWQESNNIFIHEDGAPMFPSRPYQWFQKFIERNGLPKITFHALRHAYVKHAPKNILFISGLSSN